LPTLAPNYAPHEAGYYAVVKSLGLRASSNPTIFIDSEGWPWCVPSAVGKSPMELEEILADIKRRMNILPRGD
jgi:hypothetical protein